MNKTIRNLIIFAAATPLGGFIGIALDRANPPADPMQGLGALVWLITPLVTHLLLRAFGGDGWQDLGLRPHLRSSWRWYLVALFIFPVAAFVTMGVGVLFGAISLEGLATQGFRAFLSFLGINFAAAMVKNIFEEFAWRGYLTPRLASLKLHPAGQYIITGFIWASWHIPYYLYFLNQETLKEFTTLSLGAFILLSFVLLPLHAVTYGELRRLSGSVWPAWLLHNVANALTFTLITNQFIELEDGRSTLFSPGTEGILSTILFALLGVGLYQYRMKRSQRSQSPAPTPAPAIGTPL